MARQTTSTKQASSPHRVLILLAMGLILYAGFAEAALVEWSKGNWTVVGDAYGANNYPNNTNDRLYWNGAQNIWQTASGTNHWVRFNASDNTAKKIDKYTILEYNGGGYTVYNWSVSCSNDSTTWTVIDIGNNTLPATSNATANLTRNATTAGSCKVVQINFTNSQATTTIEEIFFYYDDTPPAGAAAPNITFVNRTPSDLTSTALFSQAATFTYQYNTTGLVVPYLEYYLNSTISTCVYVQNGTCLQANASIRTNIGSNTTVNNTYSVGENSIYPSIQNTNTSVATINVLNITGTNTYLYDAYQNISTRNSFGFYEFMVNSTGTFNLYYANASYDFNSNPSLSPNAHLLCTVNGSAVNHTHGSNWDNLCAFTINASGFIGDVKATSEGGFILRGNTQGILLYGYSGAVRTNVSHLTTNSGTSWTTPAITLRSHLHQFSGSDVFCWAGKGNYTSGTNPQSNGTMCDTLNVTLQPPEPPTVYTPTNSTYGRFINITYEQSNPTVPNSVVTYYNITLRNNDSTFNATIYQNNSINTSYYWNTYALNLSVGTPYRVRVTAYENNSLSSYAESEAFTVSTNGLLNLTARTRTNTTINNVTTFTIWNTTAGFSNTTTASPNGTALIDIIKEYSYTVSVNSTGYAVQNITVPTITSNLSWAYAYLFREQTVNITFLEELTYTLVNGTTIQAEFISNTSSYNYTTTTGRLFVDLLTPDAYTIRYGANNYSTRFYALTITSQSFQELNLSMCPDTICSQVTIEVKDQFDNPLEGAIIRVLKYDVLQNGYVLNEILATNFEGQTQANIQINNEYYKFIIEYDGATVLSTLPTYVYGSTLTFVVNIGATGFEEYFDFTGLWGNIVTVAEGSVYAFGWTDEENTASSGCLYAYSESPKTLYNYSCVAGAAGVTFVTVDNASTEGYTLYGVVNKYGTNYTLDSEIVTYITPLPDTEGLDLFILFMVLLAITFVGVWSPTIGVILAGITPFLLSVAGIVNLSVGVTSVILILSIIIAYIVNR